jgi:hypothetical protein
MVLILWKRWSSFGDGQSMDKTASDLCNESKRGMFSINYRMNHPNIYGYQSPRLSTIQVDVQCMSVTCGVSSIIQMYPESQLPQSYVACTMRSTP